MDKIINLRLLSHPMNWFVVWTVLMVAGCAWMMLHEQLTGTNTPSGTP